MTKILEDEMLNSLEQKASSLKEELKNEKSKEFVDELLVFVKDSYYRFNSLKWWERFIQILIGLITVVLFILSNS